MDQDYSLDNVKGNCHTGLDLYITPFKCVSLSAFYPIHSNSEAVPHSTALFLFVYVAEELC